MNGKMIVWGLLAIVLTSCDHNYVPNWNYVAPEFRGVYKSVESEAQWKIEENTAYWHNGLGNWSVGLSNLKTVGNELFSKDQLWGYFEDSTFVIYMKRNNYPHPDPECTMTYKKISN